MCVRVVTVTVAGDGGRYKGYVAHTIPDEPKWYKIQCDSDPVERFTKAPIDHLRTEDGNAFLPRPGQI